MTPKRSIILLCLIILLVLAGEAPCAPAQGNSADQLIIALSRNPKVKIPEQVLAKLVKNHTKTRVIVNLDSSAAGAGTSSSPGKSFLNRNLRNVESRNQLKAEIDNKRQGILEKLDKNEINLTNKFDYIFSFSAETNSAGFQSLVANPDVLSIEEDTLLKGHLKQGIPLMNASAVRNSFSGAGVAIAICDTGIDYTHPRLGGGGFPNSKVIGGYDTGANDADPMDSHGHGTACAGIAAGDLGSRLDYIGGVAPDAKLYALKITYNDTEGSAWTSDIIEAWEWAVTHQYDDPANPIMVISTSFGGGSYNSACDTRQHSFSVAAANARSAGITIFVSSGNDGYCDAMGSPACLSGVVSVGAVYDSSFGSYYPCIDTASCAVKFSSTSCTTGFYSQDSTAVDVVPSYSNTASFLSLLAPANAASTTYITGSGYTSSFGGTSAASPYAAGAAAVLQSSAKSLSGSFLAPAEVEAALINSGVPITDNKISSITKPRIDLQAAFDSLDSDGDGVLNINDICPGGDDNLDTDGDGVPDFCDICPGSNDVIDSDADGVPDGCDICPGGADSADSDADGVPDFCDQCPGSPDSSDQDVDGVPDGCDHPNIAINPLAFNYGAVITNHSGQASFMVSNTGTDPLNVLGANIAGDVDVCLVEGCPVNDVSAFAVQNTDCGIVAEGGNCTVEVSFNPYSGMTGGKVANLYINSDDRDTPSLVALIEGIEDSDSDGDEIADSIDNCINTPNTSQLDLDQNGLGFVCDSSEQTQVASRDVIDAPHNSTKGIGCKDCHSYSLWWEHSPIMAENPSYKAAVEAVCVKCHDSNAAQAHSNSVMVNMGYNSGRSFDLTCTVCHNPHRQEQTNWAGTDTDLNLVTGTVASVLAYNLDETTIISYNRGYAHGNWTSPASWSNKTGAVSGKNLGLIFEVPAAGDKSKTFEVIGADPDTILLDGIFSPTDVGASFRLFYGALLKEKIETPNNGPQFVKYFNPKDPLTGSQLSDFCQVCHSEAQLPSDADHTFQEPCSNCHKMSSGFAPNL